MLVLRDTVEGERKEVSVVIVDVAGSLAMADALDPEDVHAIMDGLFALALEAVHAEGGTLNQFRGDGFMALFGAPRARGDDAARALRAALLIRDRAREYGESVRARYGVPFAVRIGVNTGEVWVGAIGSGARRDYTAEGPTVGLAARLEAAAAPGQVLVGPDTVALCGRHFELVDRGTRELRGVSDPVRVHELVREGVLRARLDLERVRGLTPFVARHEELARLSAALDTGVGTRAVEVCGEPGVGKSRLVVEWLQRLPEAIAVLEGACREPDVRRAYVPWLSLFRRWPADLAGARRVERLVERIEGRSGALPDPEEVAGDLAAVLAEAARVRPLVLFLDDAQWLDPSSRALVSRLTARPPEGSLLWIATLREGEAHDWGSVVPREQIALGPLSPRASAELAGRVLVGIEGAEELSELACHRGGGNALFVEEVARALRDGGESARETARLELSLARARSRIPDSLHGVVAARIDVLPEGAKRLLEAAAVLGPPLTPELLEAIVASGADDTGELLELLVDRGLLRHGGGDAWDFCHGLVCEGAYAQLVRSRRGGLHRRAAEALAAAPDAKTPAGVSRIASHWDRADEPDAAARCYLAAGEGYLRLHAFAEAASHLRRGLELLRALDAEPRVLVDASLQLATALNALDRAGEAAAVLEAIRVEESGPEDRRRIAHASVQAGWVCFSEARDATRARTLLQRGLALAEALPGSDELRLLAHSHLSLLENFDGEIALAIRHARSAVELAGARGEPIGLALALFHESAALRTAGRTDEAREAVARLEQLFPSERSDFVVATSQVALAAVLLAQGDPNAALAAAERGREAARAAGQVGLQYQAAQTRAGARILLGELREAWEDARQLAALHDGWPSTRVQVARTALEMGDVTTARAEALRGLEADPPRATRAHLQALLGLATGLSDDPERGEELLLEAVSTLDACGLRPALAEAHGFLAELVAHAGDRRRADYYAERSIAGYRECGMPAHAEHVRRALASGPD